MKSEGFKTVAEIAEAWNVSTRRVRDFCASGRIPGVVSNGRSWLLPAGVEKPADGRSLNGKHLSDSVEKDTECVDMSDRNMMDYCPDIKVFDATMRDGGLVNNFGFTDEFVKALYEANLAAGVDYMEFGYRASKNVFNPNEYGKWKFSDEADIRAIVGENKTPLKIAVMADAGRTDYKTDILPKKDSVVDMIRVACYIHQIPLAIDMIEDAKAKGYEVSCNLMAVSKVAGEDLQQGLEMIAKSPADLLYLVDSYGNFYPEQIAAYSRRYVEAMRDKQVGFHGHNNQQLAFANTIESCRHGVNYLDVTVNGMGRGAGNCFSEQLLSFLKNPKYSALPIIAFIEKWMMPLKAAGVKWGYDIPYLLTGVMNCHPRSAIKFIADGRSDYSTFAHELLDMD